MQIETSAKDVYEGVFLGFIGDMLVFRDISDELEDGESPAIVGVPLRVVIEVTFENESELSAYREAYPMGWAEQR